MGAVNDPYAHINRVHRDLVDSPWGPVDAAAARHPLRAAWKSPPRRHHLRIVRDYRRRTAWRAALAGLAAGAVLGIALALAIGLVP